MNCEFELFAGIVAVAACSITFVLLWVTSELEKIINRLIERNLNLCRIIDMHEPRKKKGRWAYERP